MEQTKMIIAGTPGSGKSSLIDGLRKKAAEGGHDSATFSLDNMGPGDPAELLKEWLRNHQTFPTIFVEWQLPEQVDHFDKESIAEEIFNEAGMEFDTIFRVQKVRVKKET